MDLSKNKLKMKRLFFKALVLFYLVISGCIGGGSCEQFNIDSFEITSGMNIPKVTSVDCFENDSLRISLFYLNTENPDFLERYKTMSGYVSNYNMTRVAANGGLNLKGNFLLPKGLELTCNSYFETSGMTKKGRYWKYLICEEEKLLIAEMVTK